MANFLLESLHCTLENRLLPPWYIFRYKNAYKPSLDEIKQMVNKLINFKLKKFNLMLKNIEFTEVTADYFSRNLHRMKIVGLSMPMKSQSDVMVLKEISNSTIEKLNLADSTVRIQKIIEFVKNSVVESLNLSGCKIVNEDAALLIDQLGEMDLKLDLSNNDITDDGVEIICQSLSRIKIQSIHLVESNDNPKVVASDKEFEKSLEIQLLNNRLTDRGMHKIIKSISNYQKLSYKFPVCNLSTSSIADVLKYRNNDFDNSSVVANDDNNPEIHRSLKNIKLFGIEISGYLNDSDIEIILRGLTDSQTQRLKIIIDVSFTSVGIDKIFTMLPRTQINELSMAAITDDNSAKLITDNIQNTKLTHLDLGNSRINKTRLSNFIDVIPISNLIELKLKNLSIDDELLIKLSEVLKLTKIVKLDLANNKFTSSGLRVLDQALPETKIKSLDLSSNVISDSSLLSIIISALNCKFIELSLCDLELSDENVSTVLGILEEYYLFTLFSYKECSSDIKKLVNRNKRITRKAASVIKQFQNDTLEFNKDSRDHLSCYQLAVDHYELWAHIPESEEIKKKISNRINENYFKITGIIKHELSPTKTINYPRKTIADLPSELLQHICSYLLIKDVIVNN